MITKIKNSLVLKTALVFIFAAMVPFLLTNFLILNRSRTILHESIVKGLASRAEIERDNMDLRLYMMRSNAAAWANNEVMKDILVDDIDKRISHTLQTLKKDYKLDGEIYAINKEGVAVGSSRAEAVGLKRRGGWFEKALAGEIVDMDRHVSDFEKEEVFSFAAPVRAQPGRVIGAVLVEYHMKDLRDMLQPGTAVIDASGTVLTVSGDSPYSEGESGVYSKSDTNDLLHRHYIISLAGLMGHYDFAGFGWSVALAVREQDVMRPVINIEQITALGGLLGALLILGLVSVFANRAVRSIKELSAVAEKVAETKDLSLKAQINSRDEVGRLAESFNYMIREVSGYIVRIREMEEIMRRTDRLSALGELSAGMAHEIKNPLGIIKSSAEMLKGKLDGAPRDKALMVAISEEATRLAGILDAFLQFARPRPPQMTTCRINSLVEKALSLLEQDMNKEGILVVRRLDTDLPEIITDKDQIHQILVNLMINAIHAMPEGGTMEISTKCSDYNPLDGNYAAEGLRYISIDIADTGTGIPPEYKDKIFNPFFTTKDKGTGLGLAIVHNIINGLGGWVVVEDVDPHGAKFRIYLPLNRGNG